MVAARSLKLKRFPTGLKILDEAVGGLVAGSAHLFYGEEGLLQRLFNTIAAASSAENRVLVITLRDYHHARSIDVFSLAEAAAALGVDPDLCLKNILVANAYSRSQALALGRRLAEQPPEAELAVVLHLTDLYAPHRYGELLLLVSLLKTLLARGLALALFAKPSPRSRNPLPDGPVHLRHFSAVIVRVEKARSRFARLVVEKGPSPTPLPLYARVSGPVLVDVDGWF